VVADDIELLVGEEEILLREILLVLAATAHPIGFEGVIHGNANKAVEHEERLGFDWPVPGLDAIAAVIGH